MPGRGRYGPAASIGSRLCSIGKASRHKPQASSAHKALIAAQPRPVRRTPHCGKAQNTASSTPATAPRVLAA